MPSWLKFFVFGFTAFWLSCSGLDITYAARPGIKEIEALAKACANKQGGRRILPLETSIWVDNSTHLNLLLGRFWNDTSVLPLVSSSFNIVSDTQAWRGSGHFRDPATIKPGKYFVVVEHAIDEDSWNSITLKPAEAGVQTIGLYLSSHNGLEWISNRNKWNGRIKGRKLKIDARILDEGLRVPAGRVMASRHRANIVVMDGAHKPQIVGLAEIEIQLQRGKMTIVQFRAAPFDPLPSFHQPDFFKNENSDSYLHTLLALLSTGMKISSEVYSSIQGNLPLKSSARAE